MASPSLVSQTFSQSAGVIDTTFTPTLSTHAAGDMLEVDVGADDNIGISITSGSGGWTKAWELQNTQGSTTPTYAKFYKLAASSSESLGLTGTAGQAWGASCRVYRGGGGTLNYYTPTPVDGTDSGSSANGQGSAVAPGAGSQDFTFTSCIVQDGVQGASAGPSGYGNFQTNANTTASRVEISTSEKAATASSDTPGAWTSAAEQWIVGGGAVWETAGGTTHATSGALVGPGSAVDGTAAHIAIHGTSGALSGQGAVIVGSAARTRVHPSSGDLTGPGASIVGAANRTRVHPTSGDLAGPGSDVSGTAARTRAHPSSGDLVGPGSDLSGSAARTRVHPTAGVLTGQGSVLVGQADHQGAAGTHNTTGALVGPGSALAGTAARFRAFATSGDLIGPGSVLTGSAARVGAPVTHETSGNLVGAGSSISGVAQNGAMTPRAHGPDYTAHRKWWLAHLKKLEEEEQEIEPEAAEIIEAKAVQTVDLGLRAAPKDVKRRMENVGIAYRDAYREVYLELVRELRQARADEEDEEEAIAMALIF